MQWFKQSTAASLIVGPILDSAGAEYTGAVIGDLSLSKNGGTLTALASAATLTHIANGQYTLALTTGNTDTLGRADITCNKSTYQMPPRELMVLPATVYDALVTNATTAAGGLGDIQRMAGTALTARDIGASVLLSSGTGTGQVKLSGGYVAPNWGDVGNPTTTVALTGTSVLVATGGITAASIADGAIDAATFAADVDAEILSYLVDDATRIDASALNTLSGHDPGATLGTSTLTQTQVTGGAYALNSASFAFNAALPLTTQQKADANAEADTALSDYGALKPTTAGRTLDVTATGAAGIDWANVENPTTTVGLTGTTISTTQAVASVSGTVGGIAGTINTLDDLDLAQDNQHVFTQALIKQLVPQITLVGGTGNSTTTVHLNGITHADDQVTNRLLIVTDGQSGLMYPTWVTDWVQSTSLATVSPALPFTPDSGDADTYTLTTVRRDVEVSDKTGFSLSGTTTTLDALQTALNSAHGSGSWATATGFSTLDAAGVRTAVGLGSANLDTQLADIPTNSELATALINALTTALTEGYRGTGATGSVRDMLYEILGNTINASNSGTTRTVKMLDKTTTAKTYTYDSGSNPTSVEETT